VPAPAIAIPDRRPSVHLLRITREAVDVIGACARDIADLGTCYGHDSDIGCKATIRDDGTVHQPNEPTTDDHEHLPSYPVGAPQPGNWSLHSEHAKRRHPPASRIAAHQFVEWKIERNR
jgi:hypothetical protein